MKEKCDKDKYKQAVSKEKKDFLLIEKERR